MVFARSIPRLVRPASSLFVAAGRPSPLSSRGASLLRQRYATPQIRTALTGPPEKVKVLLVLYDGQSILLASMAHQLLIDQLQAASMLQMSQNFWVRARDDVTRTKPLSDAI